MTLYTIVNILSVCVALFLVLQLVQWIYGRVYRLALQRERDGWYRMMMGEAPQIEGTVPLTGGRGSPEWRASRKARRSAEHKEFERDWEEAKNPEVEQAIRRQKHAEQVKVLHELAKRADDERGQMQYQAARILMGIRQQERMHGMGQKTHWYANGKNDDDYT